MQAEKSISSTIASIANDTSDCLNIELNILQLIFDGNVLDNPKGTIDGEGIAYNDTIKVPMWIHVHDYNGGVTTMIVEPDNDLSKVKDGILDFGYRREIIQFEFENGTTLLGDNTTLLDNNVHHDGHIYTFFIINVVGFDGTSCKLKKVIGDTIESISKDASGCLGIPDDVLNLTYNGDLLDDLSNTIDDEDINYNGTLVIPMWIHVHDYNGGVTTIVVEPDDELDDIKDRISDLTGIPKDTINFEHGDGTDLLGDDTTLIDNNVGHDGDIYMPFVINVEGFDGTLSASLKRPYSMIPLESISKDASDLLGYS